jgi:N-acetylmuramic acid 6-phosphate (MurNAc-6-P) etherase
MYDEHSIGEARRRLAAAGGALKSAIVMECANVDAAQAEHHLRAHGHNVRETLNALNRQP